MTKAKAREDLELFGRLVKEAIRHPDLTPDRLTILSLSEEEQNRVLTPKRLELVRVIRDQEPETISELAELVGRRVDSVSRDLRILSTYGIIEFMKRGREKKIILSKDLIILPLLSVK